MDMNTNEKLNYKEKTHTIIQGRNTYRLRI